MMSYNLSDDEPEIETLDISNDYYYQPIASRITRPPPTLDKVPHSAKLSIPKYGSRTIRHSLPAYDLWKPFFPTYVSEAKFRSFHRPKLRHYNNGPQSRNRQGIYPPHPVKSLSRHIFRSHNQLKNKIVKAINDGMSREDIMSRYLLIKEARELSAKTGEVVLFEYCEEYPPVLSQVGMASNVKIYSYVQHNGTSSGTPKRSTPSKTSVKTAEKITTNSCNAVEAKQNISRPIGFEEVIKDEKQSKRIYFNPMKAGSTIKMIENNLYRAPIYEHELPSCDFLVVRTRNSYYIRQVKTIFTVGQTLPLAIIPPPTQAQIQRFRCDLSNVYIHKLFKASDTKPPSIKLDDIARLFPDYDRSVLLRRMRVCGVENAKIARANCLVRGKSSYGDIPISKLRSSLRPEVYCLNMSMLAARQRLRELNYSETMIHPTEPAELEPEVLAAPWNTTKAVFAAMLSKSYLDLEKHLVDPTGPSREGFSCVSIVKSATEEAQAKELASRHQQAKQPDGPPVKFMAHNPLRTKIIQEKVKGLALFQKEAQLIYDIQSRCLSLDDPLTSSEDEDEDSENMSESGFSQELETLNRMVLDGRTNHEVTYEKEEAERKKLMEMLNGNRRNDEETAQAKKVDEYDPNLLKNKVLYITRTYEYNGKPIHSSEIVRDRRIIALYVKQKGGSLVMKETATNDDKIQSNGFNGASEGGDGSSSSGHRSRSASLGPEELCRADGTILRISKKVLQSVRPTKDCHGSRRQSSGA